MILFATGAALMLSIFVLACRFFGFSAQKPGDYTGKSPAIDLRTHLSGPMLCEGVIYGPSGRVTSRFVAQMQGKWSGNSGTLTEAFRYDSGKVQTRHWSLALGKDGSIRAEAPDLIGTGHGRVEGPCVMLRYRIRLERSAGGHVLDVTDWMYLMENGTIINRSQFRKWGLKVAELVATMRPMPQPAA
tara:strand:- start:4915 stop:5475 length:561 start_codon:yes stop_codon:yes gene_type:complete